MLIMGHVISSGFVLCMRHTISSINKNQQIIGVLGNRRQIMIQEGSSDMLFSSNPIRVLDPIRIYIIKHVETLNQCNKNNL